MVILMADVFDKNKRSEIMKKVRSKNNMVMNVETRNQNKIKSIGIKNERGILSTTKRLPSTLKKEVGRLFEFGSVS